VAVTRRLIVNADDFGQTPGINEGVIRCHESGVLTSASLMVRWPWAASAADYARVAPALSVGLHIDLGEWTCVGDAWVPLYEVVDQGDAAAVAEEVARQFERFRRLMHTDPTHIDSHQHAHCGGVVRAVAMEMGNRLGVPIRGASGRVAHRGEFYGQTDKGSPIAGALGVDRLLGILTALPEGTTELCCHPGVGADAPGMYVAEREEEVAALCDARVRETLAAEKIQLISFRDLARPASERTEPAPQV